MLKVNGIDTFYFLFLSFILILGLQKYKKIKNLKTRLYF